MLIKLQVLLPLEAAVNIVLQVDCHRGDEVVVQFWNVPDQTICFGVRIGSVHQSSQADELGDTFFAFKDINRSL